MIEQDLNEDDSAYKRYFQPYCYPISNAGKYIPNNSVAGSGADDVLRYRNDGLDGEWMTGKAVTDVTPLTKIEEVENTLLASAKNLLAVLHKSRNYLNWMGLHNKNSSYN